MKAPRFDLAATLASGQSFCWRQVSSNNAWQGWIGPAFCEVRQAGAQLQVRAPGLSAESAARYFGLDEDLESVLRAFPQDAWMRQALGFAPGLRLLRQPLWETTANFICSSLKRIAQIERLHAALRARLGVASENGPHFPTAEAVAGAGEAVLRQCGLGFRARHLLGTARAITEKHIDLEALRALPTPEARAHLLRLPGVGRKVADCILLFAYGRREVFPLDTWTARALQTLYWPRRRRVTLAFLHDFAADYFGPQAGYAQQYLFHWFRACRGRVQAA